MGMLKSRVRTYETSTNKAVYPMQNSHYNVNMGNNSILLYDEKMVFSACETAKILGIGMNAMYERLASGEVPSRRIGRKYLIPKTALENWLNGSVRIGCGL